MSGETKSVSAWACGMCSALHASKRSADECCTCNTCEKKFAKKSTFSSMCQSCSYGSELRSTRAAVERAREDLNRSRDRLQRLIENPPDGKKRPKDDVIPPRDETYTHLDGTLNSSAWAPLYEVRD